MSSPARPSSVSVLASVNACSLIAGAKLLVSTPPSLFAPTLLSAASVQLSAPSVPRTVTLSNPPPLPPSSTTRSMFTNWACVPFNVARPASRVVPAVTPKAFTPAAVPCICSVSLAAGSPPSSNNGVVIPPWTSNKSSPPPVRTSTKARFW